MALKPLNCTRCGAPLRDPPQNELIRCSYCGQNHHFDPDPDPPPAPAQVEMPAYARRMWMVPIAVSLIGLVSTLAFLFAGKGPAPGGAAGASAITPSSDGPGEPNATYAAGEAVEVWWGSQWWKGTIKRVNGGGSYHIGYDGWSSSWDEDVTARRLRRRAAE